MGDIYQNPNNKLPKNINNDMGHISKKQQQMMGSGMAQGQQNGGVDKYLQNQTASPSQTFFKGKYFIYNYYDGLRACARIE